MPHRSPLLCGSRGQEPTFVKDGQVLSSGSVLFCAPKHYRYRDPGLRVTRDGDTVIVQSDAYAGGVCIMDGEEPALCSDNFFDMEAGEVYVRLEREPAQELRAVSVYGIGR